MGMLLALGYMISSLFGMGMLLMPQLIQQAGVGYFILALTVSALALNLAAYIVLELIQVTGDSVENSVRSFLGRSKPLVPASLGVFTYSALTAYVVGAGNQLSAWLGGDPHYWSALFFVLAALPAVSGLTFTALTSTYLSFFLITVVVFVIPINLKFSSFVPPVFGSASSFWGLVALSVFALAGHFAVYEVHNLVRNEKKDILIFFVAFALAYLAYLGFGIGTSAVTQGISELSTVTLAEIYPPFYALLISAVAVLAFYTSFITVAHSFLRTFQKYVHHRTVYAALLLPVAVLYLLIRDYGVLSLTSLVTKLGGVSLLLFFSLASFAHYKASEKWQLKVPPLVSRSLSAIFGFSAIVILLI